LKIGPDGCQYNTYKETALVLGLLEDGAEYNKCLDETITIEMTSQMRQLFAMMLIYSQPANRTVLFESHKNAMGNDIISSECHLP